ncbi:Rna polymerase ii c-terminal domain phosphatase-like [Thalictrum thalictroides]|uniref:protein-serine/threonine phosphatase n=1 Tax=Thalictrum thalictroides TaxID=46969 RepID=A0A7J6UXL6_THATH|nr:Rna polymerase ii c-terminal domain phosphatase-like [Thalictrum thalictroides]
MLKSVIYQGDTLLGEVEIHTLNHQQHQHSFNNLFMSKEIRISHFSISSERCSPLSVLHTISPFGLSFKLESTMTMSQPLCSLHSTCLRENKTAIMQLGEEELHLVAMSSRKNSELYSYFWCFIVGMGLYDSCLIMLNLRCLGIVFDLDETLVVANTMRSFEDRIDALQRKINTEMDPQRVDGMLAEMKRYHDDKAILKQYLENDQIVDDGMIYKVQSEVVPAFSDNHPSIVRPLIRLPEKNIILTRINPAVRDTSVLVRLRPAWEDLRNYLTARGRKRFEVYVCTMAEKDYALEMWRLLDPGLKLINSNELLNRIVCVKAGSRKSLLNVFHASICHPKMALVIDDRLKVWEEKDQPRVHVVPPFVPYYAPQAEANNTIPVLCVARNVACNVRGGFYKEFDEGLLQRLADVFYEDDVPDIPSPDVSNYLISEDDTSGSNKDPIRFEGISNAEVERRLKETIPAQEVVSNLDARPAPLRPGTASSNLISQQPSQGSSMLFQDKQLSQLGSSVKLLPSLVPSQSSLQGSPSREEGELPESDIDPDIRRRLLILQHGQDKRDQMTKDLPYPVRPPVQASQPPVQSHGSWSPLAEEMSTRQPNQALPKILPGEFPSESEAKHFDKHQPSHTSYFYGVEGSVTSDRTRFDYRKPSKEARRGENRFRLKQLLSNIRSFPGEESTGPLVNSKKDSYIDRGQDSPVCAETSLEVLQDIANKCRTKVEFRPALIDSNELQFSVEVWFAGERIGEGNGRTRKEAQHQASEFSIKALANKYLSTVSPDPTSDCEKLTKLSQKNESDASGDSTSFGRGPLLKEDRMAMSSTSESSRFLDLKLEGSKKSEDSVFVLKQLCFKEGLALMIKGQPTLSLNSEQKEEEQAQVEIEGNVLGTGTGSTWEEAKLQAAEEALGNLNSMIGTRKRQSSPKSSQAPPSKRFNSDSSRDPGDTKFHWKMWVDLGGKSLSLLKVEDFCCLELRRFRF